MAVNPCCLVEGGLHDAPQLVELREQSASAVSVALAKSGILSATPDSRTPRLSDCQSQSL
eukprot:13775357-Alexandrium_andersonii.AAC.1